MWMRPYLPPPWTLERVHTLLVTKLSLQTLSSFLHLRQFSFCLSEGSLLRVGLVDQRLKDAVSVELDVKQLPCTTSSIFVSESHFSSRCGPAAMDNNWWLSPDVSRTVSRLIWWWECPKIPLGKSTFSLKFQVQLKLCCSSFLFEAWRQQKPVC